MTIFSCFKLKKFKLKALYSLNIAFYGFTKEETQHMKEVTIENGGTPINDINDPNCTHIVINDQEVKQLPTIRSSSALSTMTDVVVESVSSGDAPACQSLTTTATITPTSKSSVITYLNTNMSPFSNTRAHIVRTEWFWVSIQICCRASECLYEFTKVCPRVQLTAWRLFPLVSLVVMVSFFFYQAKVN